MTNKSLHMLSNLQLYLISDEAIPGDLGPTRQEEEPCFHLDGKAGA